jgi:hypothetical protein
MLFANVREFITKKGVQRNGKKLINFLKVKSKLQKLSFTRKLLLILRKRILGNGTLA